MSPRVHLVGLCHYHLLGYSAPIHKSRKTNARIFAGFLASSDPPVQCGIHTRLHYCGDDLNLGAAVIRTPQYLRGPSTYRRVLGPRQNLEATRSRVLRGVQIPKGELQVLC